MTETLYRALGSADIEVRSAGGKRELRGIVVPYNAPTRIDASLVESFAPGAFRRQLAAPHRIPLFRDHQAHGGTLIGRALEFREDAAGLFGAFRVSPTAAGDEALALVQDEALSHWSIGFREGQNRQLSNGTIERRSATLTETALVLQGAYGDLASVSEVREQHACACGAADRLARAAQILASIPPLPASIL